MRQYAFALLVLASPAAFAQETLQAQKTQPISEITDVQVLSTRSLPPIHTIVVFGHAATPGWSDLSLREMTGKSDGFLHLEFVGLPASGMAAQVMSKVQAQYGKPIVADNYFGRGRPLKGVVVHGQTNTKTVRFAQ